MTNLFDSVKERYSSVAASVHPNDAFRAEYRRLWMNAALCVFMQILFLGSLGYCVYAFVLVMYELGPVEVHLQAWRILRQPELVNGSMLYVVRYVLVGAGTLLVSYFLSSYLSGELEKQATKLLDIPIE